ncbi:MAG: M20 family metallopeptidase [Actinobacteria bacterium]|nr:M20 family metallopeptidase [Actinomycetota bacterium]
MNALTDAIESLTIDEAQVIDLTQRLVRIPSVFRPEDGLSEAPVAELVAEQMRTFGWEPKIDEVAPGRPNVVSVIEGGLPGPTLLFEGHTDVVTEGDRSKWTRDPFGGEVEGGRLYGRGSADMKGGVAAMICAAQAVRRTGPFPGRIIVAALVDEEGLMLGAKHFVARGHAEGIDAAIICEPEGGEVCVAQKGAIRVRVEAVGRMAHGAMPEHGANPVPVLASFVKRVGELQLDLQQTAGSHPHLGLPYITPTVFRGGELAQLNVIPGRAELALDIRTVPAIDHSKLLASIEDEVEAASTGEVRLSMEIIDDRPASEIPEDAPVVQALVEAHEEVTGQAPSFGGVPGTTDGTILWRDAQIPIVVYGPGGKWIAHQVDEFVEVSDLIESAKVFAGAAIRFLHWEGEKRQ